MLADGTFIQNRYQIVRKIGQGGMGAVYEAIDTRLGNRVALKQTIVEGEQFDRAFEREARLLASLRHAALPVVSDFFSEGEGQFLIMQYIPGDDLATLLKQRSHPFPVDQVLDWADQILSVLEYLHRQEPPIIHRDIKPQNLKLTSEGQVVLLDFGLAKGMQQSQTTTTTRSLFGYTPQYAPMEQIQGTGTDSRSDLYAVGATIYNLLSGQAPADALTRGSRMLSGEADSLKPVHEINAEVPVALSQVLLQAMSMNPRERFQTATAMRMALQQPNAPAMTGETVHMTPLPPVPATGPTQRVLTSPRPAESVTQRPERPATPVIPPEPAVGPQPDSKPSTLTGRKAGAGLMLGWMLTSSLCCAIVCGTTALMVIGKLPGEINMLIVLLNLLVMPFGFIGSQWFILRQYMRRVLGWLPATLIGGVLGIILASIVLVPLTFVLTEMDELEDIAINANIWLGAAWIFLGPFLFGIGISIPQALTLRRHVRGAFWWVVASMLGWAALWLSGLLAAVLLLALNSGDPPESKTVQVVFAMITGGTAGAAYAFITSIALVSMINRSHRAT